VEKEFDKNMCFLPEMLTSDSSSILTKNKSKCGKVINKKTMKFS